MGLLAATLDRLDEADEHLALSIGLSEENGLPLWAARSYLGRAEALAARGESERAREHGARALDLAREHGYRNIAAAAATLLGAESPAEPDAAPA